MLGLCFAGLVQKNTMEDLEFNTDGYRICLMRFTHNAHRLYSIVFYECNSHIQLKSVEHKNKSRHCLSCMAVFLIFSSVPRQSIISVETSLFLVDPSSIHLIFPAATGA